MKIKGTTVILISEIPNGVDEFNRTIYAEKEIQVENVLISPVTTDDIIQDLDLTGKKTIYNLAIPKADNNDWIDKKVKFFGKTWKTFGIPIEGIELNIPLYWNKKIMVKSYE